MSPISFCAYSCGRQCRLRTARAGRASFTFYLVQLFPFSMPTVRSFVTPFSAVVTPSLELLALVFFFALSFGLAFAFPFLLVLALALTLALDPADSHRRRTISRRA